MVRGRSSKRGENSIGKDFIPIHINKHTVESFQGRNDPPIRPCEASVDQGELNKAQIVNEFVEGFRLSKMKIIIVLFVGVTNHIKITTEHPRGFSRGSDRLKLGKELGPEIRAGGSINVGEEEGEVGDGRREMDRQGMGGRART